MANKWIYFLIMVIAVFEHVQSATQLRLVNGLLIIEDRQPSEEVTGNNSNSSGRSSSRIGLRENRSHDLPEHGYLNRATSSRRLLKDAQATTTRNILNARNIDAVPAKELLTDDNRSTTTSFIAEKELGTDAVAGEQQTTEKGIPDAEEKADNPKQDPDLGTKEPPKHRPEVNSVTSPTMDVITIVWYFSTFIALIAFFVVMVCSDKYCQRASQKPEEAVISAPATPAPSYREFAPPSYDSVMKKYKNRVFIVPMLNESGELKVPDDVAMSSCLVEGSQANHSQVEIQRTDAAPVETTVVEVSHRRDAQGSSAEKSEGEVVVVVVINESQGNKSASDSDSR